MANVSNIIKPDTNEDDSNFNNNSIKDLSKVLDERNLSLDTSTTRNLPFSQKIEMKFEVNTLEEKMSLKYQNLIENYFTIVQ